jgi:hypothetical protein
VEFRCRPVAECASDARGWSGVRGGRKRFRAGANGPVALHPGRSRVVPGPKASYHRCGACREGWSATEYFCAKGPMMVGPSTPGPDGFESLSPWERQVLSDIEHDLAASDPRLAEQMQSSASRRRAEWWPMSARCTVLLVPVLLVLVLAAAAVPAPWWPVLGPVTALVVVPWLLLCVKDNSRDH